jgi:hypothetical protein
MRGKRALGKYPSLTKAGATRLPFIARIIFEDIPMKPLVDMNDYKYFVWEGGREDWWMGWCAVV